MKTTLVIPCYNEFANLSLLIERCEQVFDETSVEVILVDNGSTDMSPVFLRERLNGHSFIRSVRVDVNQGYGFGILSGLRAANTELLAWTHADLQTDPADVLTGLTRFDGADNSAEMFVKGKRYGRPFADRVFTAGMGIFETILLGEKLWDINAQPTIFSRRFFQEWIDPPSDFSLDLYAFYKARHSGLVVKRFPVAFGKRAHGVSHWNVDLRSKVKFIRRTVEYSFRLRKSLTLK